MRDDPADAVLFQFKQRTEARLDRAEERLDGVDSDGARAREEISGLRSDITRTHRVVLELQTEMRSLMKQVISRLDQLAGARAESSDG